MGNGCGVGVSTTGGGAGIGVSVGGGGIVGVGGMEIGCSTNTVGVNVGKRVRVGGMLDSVCDERKGTDEHARVITKKRVKTR